jgi:diguanylate cyclase (GGDEF)-like protein
MDESGSHGLTEALDRCVRLVSVAPHLQRTFALLPQAIRIDAVVSAEAGDLPIAARQLLKLGIAGGPIRLGQVRIADGADELAPPPRFLATVGERHVELGKAELSRDLRAVFTIILGALFDAGDTAEILESLAIQSQSLSTLRRLTGHMLAATDVDQALYLMLAGITSGHGLGFNRAALFLHDPETGRFVGSKAIGPHDEAEAHRVWEAIELEDLTIESMIDNYEKGHFDTRFQQRVQATSLVPTDDPEDELGLALLDPHSVSFERDRPKNPSLAELGTAREFVLASIHPHGRLLGVLFADNVYSGAPIRRDLLEHIALFVDQTALVWENLSLLAHVAELAQIDGLTGLLNRREFDARFERERSRSERTRTPLSLLVFDVDRFKEVNDVRGHEAGDALLRAVGAILTKSTRTHDIVARYGGDELVVLLPEVTTEQAVSAAARIGKFAADEGISLSVGGATWPIDCADIGALFRCADEQLYRAKSEGRGRGFIGGKTIAFDDGRSDGEGKGDSGVGDA